MPLDHHATNVPVDPAVNRHRVGEAIGRQNSCFLSLNLVLILIAPEKYLMNRRRNFHPRWRFFVRATATLMLIPMFVVGGAVEGQEKEAAAAAAAELQRIVDKGFDYLSKEGQADDGTFSGRVGPGVTALVITAAIRHGRSLDDPLVAKGLAALEGFVKPDGGIYGNGRLKNYETCVAMVCFAEANKTGKYNTILQNARDFVTGVQYGTGERKPSDPWYGGVGYGGPERPDLSNTGYMIEALRAVEAELATRGWCDSRDWSLHGVSFRAADNINFAAVASGCWG